MNVDVVQLLDALVEPALLLGRGTSGARALASNAAAAGLFGIARGLIEVPLSHLVRDDAVTLATHVRTWFRSGAPTPARLQCRTPDPGAAQDYRVTAVRLVSDTVPYVLLRFQSSVAQSRFGALADQVNRLADEVAHRTRIQMQLRQSEERLRTVIDNAGLVVYLVTDSGELLVHNAEFTRLLGTPKSPQLWARLAEVHNEVRAHGAAEHAQFEVKQGKSTQIFHGRWVSVTDPVVRKTLICGVLSDVSVVHDAAAQRDALAGKMREAQRLESLGLLAGGIAHDFNNLLVGILGNAGIAIGDAPRGSIQDEALQDIEVAATGAADLCRQLLAYSGKGRFQLRTIDLNALLREMLQLIRVSLSGEAALHTSFHTTPLPVHVDSSQIQQVVLNLVTNAVEALNGKPGVVTVRTSSQDCDTTYLSELAPDADLAPGRYVCLEVTDTGCGMSAETRERVFDPFFTTKERGHGLGLAAVRGIATGHAGAIRVYSEIGTGTTFRVLLPQANRAVDEVQSGTRGPAKGPRRSGTVLVVDDQVGVLRTCCRILEKTGLSTLRAGNGVEALKEYDAFDGPVLAAIVDMSMPLMGGVETLRQLRARDPTLPVVLCSGFNEQDATSLFSGRGLAGFIQKPYRSADLIAALDKTIEDSAKLNPDK